MTIKRENAHTAGFYASTQEDRTFFVSMTGEIFELLADMEPREERVSTLPNDARAFERELPSMMFRMAAFVGLQLEIPPEQTHLLIDEIYWEGTLGVAQFEPPLVADLAAAGLVVPRGDSAVFSDRLISILDGLSRALIGRPFEVRSIARSRAEGERHAPAPAKPAQLQPATPINRYRRR